MNSIRTFEGPEYAPTVTARLRERALDLTIQRQGFSKADLKEFIKFLKELKKGMQ